MKPRQRPYGMHPDAWDAFLRACVAANQPARRIVQTIGNAPASAGTHARDGSADLGGGKSANYSAATDIGCREYTDEQNAWFRLKLIEAGFVAYWRHGGSWAGNEHFHVVWPGCAMKASLRDQVHQFLAHRNGLVARAVDPWLESPDHLSAEAAQRIRAMFLAHNPADG